MSEKFRTVLKDLPEHVKPVARFAYITGWRTISEILPLEWRQVDFEAFEAAAVTLDPGQTKNREGRVFPMTVDLRAVLEEQKAKRPSDVNALGLHLPGKATQELLQGLEECLHEGGKARHAFPSLSTNSSQGTSSGLEYLSWWQ